MAGAEVFATLMQFCCVGFIGSVFVFMLLVIAAVIVSSSKAKASFRDAVKTVSQDLGLAFIESGADVRAEGELRGRKVLVDMIQVHVESGDLDGGRGFDVTYTRAQASRVGGLEERILVKREGVQTKLDKMFKVAKDIELGINSEFDRRYMVLCDDVGASRAVLDAGVQSRMVGLSSHLREVLLEKEYSRCLMIGLVGDKGLLMGLLDLAVDIAEKSERR